MLIETRKGQMEDFRLYCSFARIQRGIENQGYKEWKTSTINMLGELDETKLINKYMRIKLEYKNIVQVESKNNIKNFSHFLISAMISIIVSLTTIFVTFGGWINDMIVQQSDPISVQKYFDMTEVIITETATSTVDLCIGACICVFALYFIVQVLDDWHRRSVLKKVMYYEEMLKLIEHENSKRKKHKQHKKHKNLYDKTASNIAAQE